MAAFEEIDIHGMTRTQAITAIDAKLKKCRGDVYTLTVIHGFHGGTALQEAVRKHYATNPKVKRIEFGLNQGQTELILRELQ